MLKMLKDAKVDYKVFLISVLFVVCLAGLVSAATFEGTVKFSNGTAADNANVTISLKNHSNNYQSTVWNSTLTDSDGNFSIGYDDGLDSNDYTYDVDVVYQSGNNVWVNKPFGGLEPNMIGMALDGVTFYLMEGAKIVLEVVNGSGSNLPFYYQIKDMNLGFPVAEQYDGYVTSAEVYTMKNRNYSIMVNPNESMTRIYTLNNISDYSDMMDVNVTINASDTYVWVSGNVTITGGSSGQYDFFHIIPYMDEGLGQVFMDYGSLIKNLSSNRGDYTDVINATSGIYNITLLGGNTAQNYMLLFYARNGTNHYAMYQNISVTSTDVELNVTLQELAGVKNTTLQQYDEGGFYYMNISAVNFSILDSSNLPFTDSLFVEVELDYSSYGGKTFSFVQDVVGGSFMLPLLNTSVKKLIIYPSGTNGPLKKKFTRDEINVNPVQLSLSTFNVSGIDDEDFSDSVQIEFLEDSADCNVPNPHSNCTLFSFNQDDFMQEVAKIIFGGGQFSFRMRKTDNNVTVHYRNVDMLASGPPDALFDGDGNETQSGSSLDEVWRFGSNGPDIYDDVLIGIPFGVAVDPATVSAHIDKLYDEDDFASASWDLSVNGTPTDRDNLSEDFKDFYDNNPDYFNISADDFCNMTDSTMANHDCYVDESKKMVWLRIPHFSGTGPKITGIVDLGNITFDSGLYNCYSNCTAYVNVTVANNSLDGVQNITINNSELPDSVIEYKISYYNNTDSTWNYAGDANTNNTEIIDFNLTLGDNQFMFNITMSSATTAKWNFSIQLNNSGTYYSAYSYLDAVSLSSPAIGASTADLTPDFTYTLYTHNETQKCILYINGSNYGQNTSTPNGTAATITANSALSAGNYEWLIGCNLTGNSSARTLTVSSLVPVVSLNSPANNTYDQDGSVEFNWTGTNASGTDKDLDACVLWGNFSGSWNANATVSNAESGVHNTTTLSLGNGTYVWNVKCNDSVGNSAFNGTNRTLTIDQVAPTITINAPASGQNVTTNTTINVTFHDPARGIDNTSLQVNISSDVYEFPTNITCSPIPLSNDTRATICNLSTADSDGDYTLSIAASDGLGNSNNASRAFTIDSTDPVINADSITFDDNFITSGQALWVTVNATDTTSGVASVVLSGTGLSFNSSSLSHNAGGDVWNASVNITGDESTYNLTATATDHAGNSVNDSSYQFTIQTAGPQITVTSPTEGQIITNADGNVMFNWTVIGTNLSYTNVSIDNWKWTTAGNTSNGTTVQNATGITAGIHTAVFIAIDEAGNWATNVTRNFKVNRQVDVTNYLVDLNTSLGNSRVKTVQIKNSSGGSMDGNNWMNQSLDIVISTNESVSNLNVTISLSDGLEADWNRNFSMESDAAGTTGTNIANNWTTTVKKIVEFNSSLDDFISNNSVYYGSIVIPYDASDSTQITNVWWFEDETDITAPTNLSACTSVGNTSAYTVTNTTPCFSVTASDSTTIYLPHYSIVMAGNDSRAPTVTKNKPDDTQTTATFYINITTTLDARSCVFNLDYNSSALTALSWSNNTNKTGELSSIVGGKKHCTYFTSLKNNATGANYTLTVYIDDAAGNMNITSFNFEAADTTTPGISGVRNSSITTSGAVITWNTTEYANASVKYWASGISAAYQTDTSFDQKTQSISLSSLSASTTYIYNTTSCDYTGNCNMTGTYNFTTAASSSTTTTTTSSSSGGGGGGTATSTNVIATEARIWASITSGDSISWDIANSKIAVRGLSFSTKSNYNNVGLDVSSINKPASLAAPNMEVYQYIDIDAQNLPDSGISSAKIKFRIPFSWFNANNIKRNTVKLLRYNNGWKSLSTEEVSTDSSNAYFEAETPGFSYFAIAGEKPEAEAPDMALQSPLSHQDESQEEAAGEEDGEDQIVEQKSYAWIFWLILIVVIVGLAVYFFISHRKREESQQ
ncbi:PGF-pre-PGF domain-containing protein [Candidatus Woesearchaeota archaeon]|nr:PGF-pre-PGF domain-containing protein [Candidatus Woesearchaeota archaeon]